MAGSGQLSLSSEGCFRIPGSVHTLGSVGILDLVGSPGCVGNLGSVRSPEIGLTDTAEAAACIDRDGTLDETDVAEVCSHLEVDSLLGAAGVYTLGGIGRAAVGNRLEVCTRRALGACSLGSVGVGSPGSVEVGSLDSAEVGTPGSVGGGLVGNLAVGTAMEGCMVAGSTVHHAAVETAEVHILPGEKA